MLEKANGLLLDELVDHVAEHGTDSVEPLVGLADVGQPYVIEQDLLHNEDGHGLAQLRACFHYTQAQGDDLGCQQKVDDLGRVVLDERTNDAQRREAEVLERP